MLNLLTDGTTVATKETLIDDAGLVITEGTTAAMSGFDSLQASPTGSLFVGAIIAVLLIGVGCFVVRKARRMFR